MTKCSYCNGTGKCIARKDKEEFDALVELEMDKGYFVSLEMAKERVLKKHHFLLIDCPHCQKD